MAGLSGSSDIYECPFLFPFVNTQEPGNITKEQCGELLSAIKSNKIIRISFEVEGIKLTIDSISYMVQGNMILIVCLYDDTVTGIQEYQFVVQIDTLIVKARGIVIPRSKLLGSTKDLNPQQGYYLNPNSYYEFGLREKLSIAGFSYHFDINEYEFSFESGNAATLFTYPNDILWKDGIKPDIKPNKTYFVRIYERFGEILEYDRI